MIKILRLSLFLIFLLFINNCSFQNTGGFFENKIEEFEKELDKKNSKLVFSPQKKFSEVISGVVSESLNTPMLTLKWNEDNLNSNNFIPNLLYNNKKNIVFKSKKIAKNKFKLSNIYFEPLIDNNTIFFSDYSGNIYNYSLDNKKLLWKFNFYKKRYKNFPIKIKFNLSKNNLIISDNLGYIYSINIETSQIKWAKNYGIAFNSNLKIDSNKIFILNQDNKLYVINEENGNQILGLETFPSFLKSRYKTNISLDVDNKNIFFITSNGEFYSINYLSNNINWLSNIFLKNTGSSELFYSSPIVNKNDKIFFSSSVSTYSLNTTNGTINWELPFSTSLRPIVTDQFVFLASKDGFIINIDSSTGNVYWSKSLFKEKSKPKKNKVGDIISILLVSDQILATTSKGYFLFIDYKSGKLINYTKASKSGFYSSPSIVNKMIYAIDNKLRLLIFN
tara:strand:+ start:569 stop:1915 length:1347 start_codon:yes stop_codon:yes gene_type:complete